jgi:hypothetical protein
MYRLPGHVVIRSQQSPYLGVAGLKVVLAVDLFLDTTDCQRPPPCLVNLLDGIVDEVFCLNLFLLILDQHWVEQIAVIERLYESLHVLLRKFKQL